jgi:addiction module RelE/StbE family toxin
VVSKIIWSPRALADLEDIARYIARSSPLAAESFCLRLIEHAESLIEFPQKGRMVPETQRETLRELILPPYRIAYEVQSSGQLIEIMTIWHSARGPMEF